MKKILITGPGSSGTTSLWWLFRELGFTTEPTGIETHTYELMRNKSLVQEITNGKRDWPQVIKHLGGFMLRMNEYIDQYEWDVQHIFVVLRRMDMALATRERKKWALTAKSLGVSREEHAQMSIPQRKDLMRAKLQDGLGGCIYNLVERDYPFTVLRFPRSVIDPSYCYQKLKPVLSDIWFPQFKDAWERARRQGEGISERHYEEEGVVR